MATVIWRILGDKRAYIIKELCHPFERNCMTFTGHYGSKDNKILVH